LKYNTCYEVEVPERRGAAEGSVSLYHHAGFNSLTKKMRVSGAWFCHSLSRTPESTWINLFFGSFISDTLAMRARLTQPKAGPQSSRIYLSALSEGYVQSLHLDDWTGQVMVYWMSVSEDEETSGLQLILLSLRPAAARRE
jgi:hypothetical protein